MRVATLRTLAPFRDDPETGVEIELAPLERSGDPWPIGAPQTEPSAGLDDQRTPIGFERPQEPRKLLKGDVRVVLRLRLVERDGPQVDGRVAGGQALGDRKRKN